MPGPTSNSAFAVRFFLVSVGVFALALLVGRWLIVAWPPTLWPGVRFPPAFLASTVAVLCGSVFLSRALGYVRRERQLEFRRQLLSALIAGGLFVAIQMSAINWLVQRQPPGDMQTGSMAYVAVAAALHALHFVVAMLCLIFVLLRAHADRYDHEYYWGVFVCAWFWHALSIIWIVVLTVMAIASHGPVA
ncbi:MAG: cytochrome c oxidase subunit 3 [Planctomycetaceae bacterium]|nr:cytochrome c oxidase subunit 3 [Planctomycetaceae bacterium]